MGMGNTKAVMGLNGNMPKLIKNNYIYYKILSLCVVVK